MKKTVSLSFMLMGILFNVCLLLSNILAAKRIAIFGFPASAGLLIFPVSYILNDCITEVWGFKKACFIIWSGFAMNFFAVVCYQLAIILPAEATWNEQAAFALVLGQTPRIALGSLAAFLVGSFLNAYVMSKMKVFSKGKHFGQRAILSTVAGELADSIIFCTIVFIFVIPFDILWMMILTQTSLKTLYEIIILPVTARVVKHVKRIENTDVYDEKISYNVLKLMNNE